ncbi:glycosyltransferase family 4 protein [Candidatus Uhrbacteria bacterium]|nr:glycosyltransferase family 4 protein [Candidatus Uhrbacteria bacterium]
MKVAFVHDYLIQDGGAERVLLALHELFPHAPIFTLLHNRERAHARFKQLPIQTSRLNDFPLAPRHYEWYLPFMAQAVEQFDFHGYDVVISSSSSFAKGVICPPQTLHICYCHTPTRFLWHDRNDYVQGLKHSRFVKSILPFYLHHLRQWDHVAAERPDLYITNSATSQARIKRYYQRPSVVIHPPVDVETIPLSTKRGTYWLAGGRLVSYKRFDLVVKAFSKLHLPLKIYGEGPEERTLRRLAGPKTEFLGHIDEGTKIELYQNAIGYLYPQMEDFGISAVEAMAAGRPVIAYRQGGATETVIPGVTGEQFEVQCWEDIANIVLRFDPSRYTPQRIREHAEQFSKTRFKTQIKTFIDDAMQTRFMAARLYSPFQIERTPIQSPLLSNSFL